MAYEIEVKELEVQPVLSIRQETTRDGLGAAMAELLPVIRGYLEKRGLEPSGPAFAIYHTWGQAGVDMETGFPVAEPLEGEGRIEASELPGGPAAVTWHVGPYSTIGRAHDALEGFVRERGERAGAPREVYWSGPGGEPDATKWRTEVIYPLS